MTGSTCPDRLAFVRQALHAHARQVRAYCISMSDTLANMSHEKRHAMGGPFVEQGGALVGQLRRLIERARTLHPHLGVNLEQMEAYADEADGILRRFAGSLPCGN